VKTHDILEMNANKYPSKVALVIDGIEKTFSEIYLESNSVGNALLELGIHPKDKVATLFFNDADLIISTYALLKIGAQVVPINFRLAPPEIQYILDHSEARALIYGKEFIEPIRSIKSNLKHMKYYIAAGDTKEEEILFTGLLSGNRKRPEVTVTDDDSSFLMYTSGTTGRPKGVIISHRNSLWNALSLSITSELKHDDIVFNPMPLFHGGALNRYQAFLVMGSTFISMKNFDAEVMLNLIQKYGVTYVCIVPAMANMVFQSKHYSDYDLSSVREALVTAAITPVELKKRVAKLFPNAGLVDGYGLTEATSCGTALKPKDAFRKTASVGLPYHFNEAKVVDTNGNEVEAGQVGEIIIRGPNVMQGYYKNPGATAKTIKDGWFHAYPVNAESPHAYPVNAESPDPAGFVCVFASW